MEGTQCTMYIPIKPHPGYWRLYKTFDQSEEMGEGGGLSGKFSNRDICTKRRCRREDENRRKNI